MSFGIDRRARSTKGKGLFRRAPDPKELGERLGWLLRRSEKLGLRKAGFTKGTWSAEVEFHDQATPVRLAIDAEGELRVRAQTITLGPGYHAHVLARLAPMLDELELAWTDPAPPDIAAAMCEWLAAQLADAGDDQLRIGVPEQRSFITDAPVLTPLGPRDAAWRAAAIADPMTCRDAFPWLEDKPGRGSLARALVKMWHEVAWREPIDQAEQALLEAIDEDLAAARKADAKAPIPYADWAELLHWMNAAPERIAKHRELANGATRGTIGYRRLDMEIELSGGWTIRLPGGFTGRYEDDGERFWSTDGDRTIEFQSLTAPDQTDSAALLAVAPERHPVVERLADDGRVGRAEAHTEDHVRVVHGVVVAAPEIAILTCKGTLADEAWALATWRSLRRS